jgi:hypothetical protein
MASSAELIALRDAKIAEHQKLAAKKDKIRVEMGAVAQEIVEIDQQIREAEGAERALAASGASGQA